MCFPVFSSTAIMMHDGVSVVLYILHNLLFVSVVLLVMRSAVEVKGESCGRNELYLWKDV